MSIRVMTAVFDHSEATGNDRLVLLVIADRCNDDGEGCWRGKESIAHMARVSRATVTRSLAHLEEMGELVVDRRPGTTSQYRVALPGVGSAQSEPGGRRNSELGVGSPVSRDTSKNRPFIRADEPAATRLGREVDAAPLWETNEQGEAVWTGKGPKPTSPNGSRS